MTKILKTTEPIYLSVIIPCYNEEKRIGKTLESIIKYLSQQNYKSEIRIVDDGSQDNTEKIAQSYQNKFPHIYINALIRNYGKGYAVRSGMLAAQGEFILFTDADLSTPIDEIDKLFLAMNKKKAQIVIGSRSLPGSVILRRQPWYREKMGKIFNLFVQYWSIPGIIDTQCGFKLFKKEIINPIFTRQKLWGFAFDVEILYIAQKLGYQIHEVPIRWENSPISKVNPIFDSIKMLLELRRIKKYHANLDKK